MAGFWKNLILKNDEDKENSISKKISDIIEDWTKNTVTLSFFNNVILTEKEFSYFKKIFGTDKFIITSSPRSNTLFQIEFTSVVFPAIEIPQRKEGGKHI